MENKEVILFDIGSNIGNFSYKYSNLCKVVSVEANPKLSEILKKRFVENKNVFVENFAVSNKNEMIDFFICSQDQMSSCNKNWLTTLRYKNHGIEQTIRMPSVTLDDLIKKYGYPYHIKIDVEGHELEVISGLSQKVGSIQFEYIEEEFERLTVPIFFKLKKLGYNKFYHKSPNDREDGDFNPFNIKEQELSFEEIIKRENLPNVPGGMILAA